ncbi:hypothetical protein LCGC14_1708740 [marine sediment metagenome]|uniref:Uncharacterized protein n=1 Tax=marine sediment metagenome TaxID=412755 RepID=A0A0F9JWB2_9ZZZZ
MKTAPELQHIVEQIAQKHGLDLDRPGAYLRLQLEGHGQLVIENLGAGALGARISVTNYIEVGSDYVADPQVVVCSAYRTEDASEGTQPVWLPLEFTELFGGWRLYAELDQTNDGLLLHDPVGQSELAQYSDRVLARNLIRHGWLERAERRNTPVRSWTQEEICARDIRVETLPEHHLDKENSQRKEGDYGNHEAAA